jgi:hypothetical protein
MVYAAFSVAGPDLPALAAGEIQNPRVTIPREHDTLGPITETVGIVLGVSSNHCDEGEEDESDKSLDPISQP